MSLDVHITAPPRCCLHSGRPLPKDKTKKRSRYWSMMSSPAAAMAHTLAHTIEQKTVTHAYVRGPPAPPTDTAGYTTYTFSCLPGLLCTDNSAPLAPCVHISLRTSPPHTTNTDYCNEAHTLAHTIEQKKLSRTRKYEALPPQRLTRLPTPHTLFCVDRVFCVQLGPASSMHSGSVP